MNRYNLTFSPESIAAMYDFAQAKLQAQASRSKSSSRRAASIARNKGKPVTEAMLWALLRPDGETDHLPKLFDPLQRIIEGESVIFYRQPADDDDEEDEDEDEDNFESLPDDPEDVVMLGQVLTFLAYYGVNIVMGERHRIEEVRKRALAKLNPEEIKVLGLEKN